TIWVHDYQLALVPAMVRGLLPQARIGFFLHIPFPAADVFRILPWREEILRGLLGADLIGFHTASYAYNFSYAVAQILGLETTPDTISHDLRTIRVGSYPISIDSAHFERLARTEEVQNEVLRIREQARGKCIVLGVDRLDYTKGMIRRLMSIDR